MKKADIDYEFLLKLIIAFGMLGLVLFLIVVQYEPGISDYVSRFIRLPT